MHVGNKWKRDRWKIVAEYQRRNGNELKKSRYRNTDV